MAQPLVTPTGIPYIPWFNRTITMESKIAHISIPVMAIGMIWTATQTTGMAPTCTTFVNQQHRSPNSICYSARVKQPGAFACRNSSIFARYSVTPASGTPMVLMP